MRSHHYEFVTRDLMRIIGLPLLPVAAFALLMHGGVATGLLPKPRPAFDVDRTIIIHKAEASRTPSDAQVVLIGDSSCLIDVAALQLTHELGRPANNLGTLSFLDLNDYATLLRHYLKANGPQTKAVILLMHPEALRRPPGGTYHSKFLDAFLNGKDFVSPALRDRVSLLLGLEIFRGRILARLLPTPLPGEYRRRYGFNRELEAFLTRNRGSAVELDKQPFEGSAEYRLARQLEAPSRAIRLVVPSGVKLIVGITPAPEGYVTRDYAKTREEIMATWARWTGADVVLWELPSTLPDEYFAKPTHLTENGARLYTTMLVTNLKTTLKRFQ